MAFQTMGRPRLGLFENRKLNWFDDNYWDAIGYNVTRKDDREIHLTREPVRRFEDLNIEDIESVIIRQSTHVKNVINVLKEIQQAHPTVTPNDIAIIILDDCKKIYDYIDTLCYSVSEQLKWDTNRAIETKTKKEDAIYITNPNNVKGLEFPFVICITGSLKNSYRYRNVLYTMLTRSFIQSYLLFQNNDGIDVQKKGLEIINKERLIKTIEPTVPEREEIKNTLVKLQKESNISYKEFLTRIFDELRIKKKHRDKFEKALMQTEIEKFDKEETAKFVNANKEFFCK